MRKIKPATYETADELEQRIATRECEAAQMPSGPARQSVLREIAQLKSYADVKRWVASPSQRSLKQQ